VQVINSIFEAFNRVVYPDWLGLLVLVLGVIVWLGFWWFGRHSDTVIMWCSITACLVSLAALGINLYWIYQIPKERSLEPSNTKIQQVMPAQQSEQPQHLPMQPSEPESTDRQETGGVSRAVDSPESVCLPHALDSLSLIRFLPIQSRVEYLHVAPYLDSMHQSYFLIRQESDLYAFSHKRLPSSDSFIFLPNTKS